MIHIIDIKIPNRTKWGDVFTKDIPLPAKINKIRGVMANVILGSTTYMERLVYAREGDIVVENAMSVQVGVFNISVNNTGIISTNTPLCAINELRNPTYNHNLMSIDEGLKLRGGSMARIVVEEKQISPFVTYDKIKELADELMSNPYVYVKYQGNKGAVLAELIRIYNPSFVNVGGYNLHTTNDYIIKIYIDYDK